jgi:hypothetical protein
MLIVGEVRTCLLRNSTRLNRRSVEELLGFKPGQRVLVTDRPVNRSVSPNLMIGVDCRLATDPVTKARGIGTVAVSAVATGGLVLQASARTRLERARDNNRRTWSHYAGRRGVVEVISKAEVAQLARGHRTAVGDDPFVLDLGSISERLIDLVQRRPQLDYQTVIRSRPTRMRWTATVCESDEPSVGLHVDSEVLRTVELAVPAELLRFAERFCEDLALHDWLITALGGAIDQADQDVEGGADPIKSLAAAVESLVHLWMPGAHVDPAMRVLWDALEMRPGFSLQWNAQVARIHDLISLRTLDALERIKLHETESW